MKAPILASKKAALHVVCGLAILIWFFLFRIPPNRPWIGGDAIHYMTMAYHLRNSFVLSLSEEGTQPAPTAYREPGYPAFAALCFVFTGEASHVGLKEFLGTHLGKFAKAETGLQIISALVAAWLTSKITRKTALSYLAFGLVAFNAELRTYVYELWSEPLITFLITMLAAQLYCLTDTRRYRFFASSGLLLACLTLTRGSFAFLWPLLALFFLGIAFVTRDARRRVLFGLLIFLGTYFGVTGCWMLRNWHYFGSPIIAQRGGVILNVRAEFDTMSKSEFKASFVLWSDCAWIRRYLSRIDPQVAKDLDWHYRTGRSRRTALEEQLGSSIMADKALIKEAKARILAHPLKHLAVTIAMAHRGLYIQPCPWCFVLFGSAGLLFLRSLRRWDSRLLAVMLPGFFLYAFNSFLTHSITRYNVPLIPLLWVCLIVSMNMAAQWMIRVIRKEPAAPAVT